MEQILLIAVGVAVGVLCADVIEGLIEKLKG